MKMKKTILLSFLLMIIIGSASIAQTNYDTISATYNAGDISANFGFQVLGNNSTCPGLITFPNGSLPLIL